MSTTFPGSECEGRVIDGRFRLLRRLGGTESSGVYLTLVAGDPPHSAAIKLLSADGVDGEARGKLWTAATTLSHPNLMRLLHFGQCEIGGAKLFYTVEDYAPEILSEVLEGRSLTAGEAREMLSPILSALSYLHARGLVHSRLTPSNLMAVGDRLKLSVDGIETAGEGATRSHWSGGYDAPEIAEGQMSPAADVWSLGTVLVKATTQQLPAWNRWSGGEPGVPESVPEPLRSIAGACLQVDPSRRCTLADIKARLVSPQAAKPTVPSPVNVSWKWLSSPVTKIALAAVLLAGVVVVAVELSSHRGQPAPAASSQGSAPAPASPETQPPVAEAQNAGTPNAKGAVIHQVLPDVPQPAMETIHGHFKTTIRVDVGADGNVANAAIDSEGPSRYFAEFALKAAQEWKFKPAEKDGRAVASSWNLRFVFAREGTTVTPVETQP
ncbi:MAG TPA: TonB family protein [Terracidiphilus sp.]|nr:TonB family protein [Terracidiphilus sp.]